MADGTVDELIARASGTIEIRIEVKGAGVVAELGRVAGVREVTERHDHGDGRVALSIVTEPGPDLRPAIFELAKAKGWTLYELHQRTRSLEHLFQELTVAEPS